MQGLRCSQVHIGHLKDAFKTSTWRGQVTRDTHTQTHMKKDLVWMVLEDMKLDEEFRYEKVQ